MRRKILEKMAEWKQKSNGKTALLIDGARRVGKSCAEYVKNVINSSSESKFKSRWFPNNFLVPYYAVRLFKSFGDRYQKELDIIEKYLISKQTENGSFSDSVLETSYAVLAMKAIKNKELLQNIEKA